MHEEPDRDFFLLSAVELAALSGDTATLLAREAAYCHLLFQQGRHTTVLAHLRAVSERVLGFAPPPGRSPAPDAARTLAAGADLFHRLRYALAEPAGV